MTEEKKAWHEGVPAPVDADGNIVPLTTRTLYDEKGREVEVGEIALVDSILCGRLVWRVRTRSGVSLVLDLLHLVPHDSLEKLADDLARYDEHKVMCEYFGIAADGTCDGCRAHSFRADHPGRSCIAFALDDVVSRVRALCGEERDED